MIQVMIRAMIQVMRRRLPPRRPTVLPLLPSPRRLIPILPTRASSLGIRLLLRGSQLHIDIRDDRVSYSLSRGEPVTARHRGEQFTVTGDSVISFPGEYRTHDAGPSEWR